MTENHDYKINDTTFRHRKEKKKKSQKKGKKKEHHHRLPKRPQKLAAAAIGNPISSDDEEEEKRKRVPNWRHMKPRSSKTNLLIWIWIKISWPRQLRVPTVANHPHKSTTRTTSFGANAWHTRRSLFASVQTVGCWKTRITRLAITIGCHIRWNYRRSRPCGSFPGQFFFLEDPTTPRREWVATVNTPWRNGLDGHTPMYYALRDEVSEEITNLLERFGANKNNKETQSQGGVVWSRQGDRGQGSGKETATRGRGTTKSGSRSSANGRKYASIEWKGTKDWGNWRQGEPFERGSQKLCRHGASAERKDQARGTRIQVVAVLIWYGIQVIAVPIWYGTECQMLGWRSGALASLEP